MTRLTTAHRMLMKTRRRPILRGSHNLDFGTERASSPVLGIRHCRVFLVHVPYDDDEAGVDDGGAEIDEECVGEAGLWGLEDGVVAQHEVVFCGDYDLIDGADDEGETDESEEEDIKLRGLVVC